MTSHPFNQLGLPEPPPQEQGRPCTHALGVQTLPKLRPCLTNHQSPRAEKERAASRKRPGVPSPLGSSRKQRWPVPWGGSSFSGHPPLGGPVEVASPARTALSSRKVTGSREPEALPVSGSCWAASEVGALKRSLCRAVPQPSPLHHAAQGILECPGVHLPIAGHLHRSR